MLEFFKTHANGLTIPMLFLGLLVGAVLGLVGSNSKQPVTTIDLKQVILEDNSYTTFEINSKTYLLITSKYTGSQMVELK